MEPLTPEQQLCVWLTMVFGHPCSDGAGRFTIPNRPPNVPILMWVIGTTYHWRDLSDADPPNEGTFIDLTGFNTVLSDHGLEGI